MVFDGLRKRAPARECAHAVGPGKSKGGTHSTLRILNLGVNVTVSLYDFRIDGLVARNARKLRK